MLLLTKLTTSMFLMNPWSNSMQVKGVFRIWGALFIGSHYPDQSRKTTSHLRICHWLEEAKITEDPHFTSQILFRKNLRFNDVTLRTSALWWRVMKTEGFNWLRFNWIWDVVHIYFFRGFNSTFFFDLKRIQNYFALRSYEYLAKFTHLEKMSYY